MNDSSASPIRRQRVAALLSAIVFALALLALRHMLDEIVWHDVVHELRSLSATAIAWSVASAAGSYAILTFFDWFGVRLSARRVPFRVIVQSAFIANALGHNLGMAAVTGGTVRAKAYSTHGLNGVEIGHIIAIASAGFALGAFAWLGYALSAQSLYASKALHAPEFLLRLGGPALLALLLAVAILPAFGKRRYTVVGHVVHLPNWHQMTALLVVSVLELAMAAGALFALLPDSAHIGYTAFIGLYVLALLAGVVSSVPGGLGVFEATLLILLPEVSPHVLLATILAYRTIYYLLPLLLALSLLSLSGIRKHSRRLGRGLVSIRQWTDPIVAPTFALLIFAAGASLVVRGSLPLHLHATTSMAHRVALPVLELSHLGASAIGTLMLILSRGIFQRMRVAWVFSVIGLAVAAPMAWLSGLSWPLAVTIALLIVPLWVARQRFYRGASAGEDLPADGIWLRNVVMVFALSLWLGFLIYRNIAYRNDLWWQFAFESDAPRMLRALMVSLLTLAIFGLTHMLRLRTTAPAVATPGERARAAAIVAQFGANEAHLALLPDKRLMFSQGDRGFLMYQRSGPCLIAMGDPVGDAPSQHELAWHFREAADRKGLWTVFYQVRQEHLPLYLDMGLVLSKLGEEAVVALADFSLEGPQRANVRREHRRAMREGAEFSVLSPAEVVQAMPRLRAISDRWLDDKETAEKQFSLGHFDEAYIAHFPCAVVRHRGEIIAFANLWTGSAQQSLSIDMMRYVDAGPKRIMDFLLVESMFWGQRAGYREFSLGMAPLSGLSRHALAPTWHKLGNFAWNHGERFYRFEGLRHYKEKFAPTWRPRYLASPGGLRTLACMFHISRLISGGTMQMLSR